MTQRFQTKQSYEKSHRYNDFGWFWDQFAKSKTNVIFIIPHRSIQVDGVYGLSPEMYQRTVAKIRYQPEESEFY